MNFCTTNLIKNRCTNSPWTWMLMLMLFVSSSIYASAENGTENNGLLALGCHNTINLSLDTAMCEATVDSALMLTGTIPAGVYTVDLYYDLAKTMPVPTSPMVTAADVGRTIVASVMNTTTGNSCWGYINVEDKHIPPLLCGLDTISCSASADPVLGGEPGFPLPVGAVVAPVANNPNQFTVTGFDGCSDVDLTYSDLDIGGSTCGEFNRIIKRTWIATDAAGNSVSCMDTIYLENLAAAFDPATDCPPDWFGDEDIPNNNFGSLLCEDRRDDNIAGDGINSQGWNTIPAGQAYEGHPSPYDELYSNGNVKWTGTGVPSVGACAGVQMTFSDIRLNICPSGASEGCYKIVRTWLILDWCSNSIDTCQQIIKVADEEAPVISGIEDVTISVDIWRCQADWVAPIPTLTDNCSSAPLEYSVSATSLTVEQMSNGQYRIRGLAPGVYEIFYNSSDCCGNTGQTSIMVTVLDEIPPVAVCDQHTVVGLTANGNPDDPNNGISKVFAQTFDDGSYDNCADQLWFKVIRMDEWDSNGNDKGGESVLLGDWSAASCNAANGDDDPRTVRPYLGDQSYFDDFVKVCCEDTDQPVMVVFRVFAKDPTPYEFRNVFPAANFPQYYANGVDPNTLTGVMPSAMAPGGDLYGHYSDCMVELEVDDKIPPFVVAPNDIWISCDYSFPFDPENPNDFTDEFDGIFGKVVASPASLSSLDDIVVADRVCPSHPRFADFAPASPLTDPCYDDIYQIGWGKDGYAVDNCDVDLSQTITSNLACGKGTITRSWRAKDLAGNWSNTATQTIHIIECREFYVPTTCWRFSGDRVGQCNRVGAAYAYQLLSWPCDVELNSCSGVTDDAFKPENLDVVFDNDRAPVLNRTKCNFLAATYKDTKFVLEDNACLKIFREWFVIDWCLYDEAQANPTANIVYEWSFTQVIKLVNTDGPTFTDCSNRSIDGFGSCNGAASLPITATDDCTASENLKYRYQIDFNNDGIINALGYSDNYSRNPFNGAPPARRFPAATPNADGTYDVGTHKITWTATDGCGNETSCFFLFTIRDAKPPTPFCISGVSTIPMPVNAGGFVDIWANDFNLKSSDNCTDSIDLVYSFSLDINDRARTFTCAQAGNGVVIDTLTVYVWDEAGNYATCPVQLTLSDCMNQSQATISGSINSDEGENIADVMVRLEGNMTDEQMTLVNGRFNFDNLPTDNNYSIRPEKDKNPLNGVSTYDLVKISKHILGLELLDSPYRIIAADVNKSGSITAFDMVELRKLILYIETDFPNNTSWRFIPSNHDFADASNPFSTTFPEVYAINSLANNLDIDFVAIKTGDVNGSARPNQLVNSEDRTASGTLAFNTMDQEMVAGQIYTVDFNSRDFAEVAGYQFTLKVDPELVEVAEVSPSLAGLTSNNFGTSLLTKGALTTSWNRPTDFVSATDEKAFSIRLRAKRNGKLSKAIQINSDYTAAEAYTEANELLTIELTFNTTTTVAGNFELLQNTPNPFKDATIIRFNLPKTTFAKLSIYDAAGKSLKVINRSFEKGYNEVNISRSELAGSGVLYYTLQSEHGTATRKMILID